MEGDLEIYMTTLLRAVQLDFERDQKTIFSNLEFGIKAGGILQISGPNGCGKTTLLKILCGLTQPTKGEILWQGESIVHCRAHYSANLYYLGHQAGIKAGLTVRENLQLALALSATRSEFSLESAIAAVGLQGYEEVFSGSLSAGQQRRVLFAKLLLVKARLWFLDEPFVALDCAGINMVESLIYNHLKFQGMIVLTSHQPFDLKNISQQNLVLV